MKCEQRWSTLKDRLKNWKHNDVDELILLERILYVMDELEAMYER